VEFRLKLILVGMSMFIRYARFGLLNLIDNRVVFPEPTIKTNEDHQLRTTIDFIHWLFKSI
jgi:hypothetical protein